MASPDKLSSLANRITECLSRLPDGVTVEYEIVYGSVHQVITEVHWFFTEKPVDLTSEQEQKILSDLYEMSDGILFPERRKKNEQYAAAEENISIKDGMEGVTLV